MPSSRCGTRAGYHLSQDLTLLGVEVVRFLPQLLAPQTDSEWSWNNLESNCLLQMYWEDNTVSVCQAGASSGERQEGYGQGP